MTIMKEQKRNNVRERQCLYFFNQMDFNHTNFLFPLTSIPQRITISLTTLVLLFLCVIFSVGCRELSPLSLIGEAIKEMKSKNVPAVSKDDETETSDATCTPQFDFFWVEAGRLAGMSKPGLHQQLESDLCYLEEQGITLLVSLTEDELLFDNNNWSFSYAHFPVEDFTAPTIKQLECLIELTEYILFKRGRVAVHCMGGRGRTGTFLSAYFINQGMTVDEAVTHVRKVRPGAVETSSQMDILAEFAHLLTLKNDSKSKHSQHKYHKHHHYLLAIKW